MTSESPSPDDDLLDSTFEQFVLAKEREEPGWDDLRAWMDRLPARTQERFLKRAMLYLGMSGDKTPGAGATAVTEEAATAPQAGTSYGPEITRTVGQKFGRYTVLSVLGVGGMGAVYRALDERLQRHVALKLVRGADNPQSVTRFVREARTLAGLHHANLVKVYEAGTFEDQPYLVMELIEGSELQAVEPATGTNGVRREVTWGLELARVVAWLHERKIVHRDIKPSNVLLRSEESVVLADFGLVRDLERDSSLTGPVLGTPGYMAPELVVDAVNAGPGVDVYSLACLLVERLSGCKPFGRLTPSEIIANLAQRKEPFDESAWKSVPRDLAPTLRQCLLLAPEERPSAAELVDDLDAWLHDRTLHIGARTPWRRFHQTLRTRRRLLYSLGGGALVALAGGAAWRWLDGGGSTGDPLAKAIQLVFDTGDLPSVLDPYTKCQEGMAPLAMLFLDPVGMTPKWERPRIEEAKALWTDLAGDRNKQKDACMLAACIACRQGNPERAADALQDFKASVAGLAVRAELARRANDVAPAKALLQQARDGLSAESDGADLFFFALALLTPIEAARIYSPQQHLMRFAAEECQAVLEKAVAAPSPWSSWALILQISLQRMTGSRLLIATDTLARRLPDSFWAGYFHGIREFHAGGERALAVSGWRVLRQRFPHARIVRDLILHVLTDVSPKWHDRACKQYWEEPERPILIWMACKSAIAHGRIRGPASHCLETLARAWVEKHPDAMPIWHLLAMTHAVGVAPDPGADCWDRLRQDRRFPNSSNAILQWKEQAIAERLTRDTSTPKLSEEGAPQQALFDALGVTELPRGSDLHADTSIGVSVLIARAAAHRGALAALVDVETNWQAARGHWGGVHDVLRSARVVGPPPKTATPAEKALRLAIAAELELGPVFVHSGDALRGYESVGVPLVDAASRKAAAGKLQQAVAMLQSAKATTRFDKMSVAGAALMICHAAGLLGQRDVVQAHARKVRAHSQLMPPETSPVWLGEQFY